VLAAAIIVSGQVRTILIVQGVVMLMMASFGQQQNSQSVTNRPAGVTYELGPDSLSEPGVPRGRLAGPFLFKSQIISNTVRRCWAYVPAQYTPATTPGDA
jgi:hypothetical protein